jgi:hypothetical protein
MILVIFLTGIILCLGYGIKETMENWDEQNDEQD